MEDKKINVYKIGGSVLNTIESIRELVSFLSDGIKPGRSVIIHGGGNAISYWLDRLGKKTEFINGQRVTDSEAMLVVEMVLSGLVNKELVSVFSENGLAAVGMSGRDGDIGKAAVFNDSLGRVGRVTNIKPDAIYGLLEKNIIPVLSPVCSDSDGGSINVNADVFAAEVAAALKADALNVVTNTGGVLRDDKLIDSLSMEGVSELIDNGIATVGMIPKLQSAVRAVEKGVGMVNILNYKGVVGTVIK
jgi:acetylglutamate kinase